LYISFLKQDSLNKGEHIMRAQLTKTVLTAALALAMAFTFSCSGDDGGPSSSGGSSGSGGGSCDMSGYREVPMPDGKTWMAENLNCDVAGSSGCYGNDPANCAKYGRLYIWAAAKTVCPSPWRLPSDTEWEALVTAVGGSSTAGAKLKADSPLWNDNGKGTDEFGFSALPGGSAKSPTSSSGVGDAGYWWSATEDGASYARGLSMYSDDAAVGNYTGGKTNALSVRCVRD
jgi:uncharacterized protein (TIGR02145 family)